jgi:hypothetical protein
MLGMLTHENKANSMSQSHSAILLANQAVEAIC